MEGCLIEENVILSRTEADRLLRSYKAMNSALRSSRSWGRSFCEADPADEAPIHAQMYALRSCVLALEDPRERLLLYHHYIKGSTLESCAKLLGVSRRSVYRIKRSALESFMLKMNIRKNE